jgi:tripartite ATP-independent transporter DctP family solute receptor
MQESLTTGTLEMTITGLANLYDPAFALFDFPFLYDNRTQIKNVMYSDLMKDMGQGLIKKGLRIIGLMEVGFRDVTSNKPINTPADLKGFKIRTPESPAQIECFKAMGAMPTPMSFSELYGALQQGVVDGQENPLENIFNGKLYEVQKYVNVTKHIYNFAYVFISEKFWKTLSAEDQKLIASEVKKGCLWQIDYLKGKEADYAEQLRAKGMTFVEVDRNLFREAAMGAYQSDFVKKLEPRSSEIIEQIRAIVSKY